jgi:hypothetical protein
VPTDTHQVDPKIGEDEILALLYGLLDDPADGEGATLAESGVDEEALGALWDAVCEEFAERTVGLQFDAGMLEPSMTLREAARAMVVLLRSRSHDRS